MHVCGTKVRDNLLSYKIGNFNVKWQRIKKLNGRLTNVTFNPIDTCMKYKWTISHIQLSNSKLRSITVLQSSISCFIPEIFVTTVKHCPKLCQVLKVFAPKTRGRMIRNFGT